MKRRLLRIEAPHFVAGVVWLKVGDAWTVERAAPIVGYMQRMSAADVHDYMLRKRWRWDWVQLGQ